MLSPNLLMLGVSFPGFGNLVLRQTSLLPGCSFCFQGCTVQCDAESWSMDANSKLSTGLWSSPANCCTYIYCNTSHDHCLRVKSCHLQCFSSFWEEYTHFVVLLFCYLAFFFNSIHVEERERRFDFWSCSVVFWVNGSCSVVNPLMVA